MDGYGPRQTPRRHYRPTLLTVMLQLYRDIGHLPITLFINIIYH
jgi:hypothetical protein